MQVPSADARQQLYSLFCFVSLSRSIMIVLAIIGFVLYLITDSSIPWCILLILLAARFLYILYMNHLIRKDINAYEREVKKFLNELEWFERSMGTLSEGSRKMLIHALAVGCIQFCNVMDKTGCSHRDIVMAVTSIMGGMLNDPVTSMNSSMLIENTECFRLMPFIILNEEFLQKIDLSVKMSS